jgi:Flp pilus assembly protein TadG
MQSMRRMPLRALRAPVRNDAGNVMLEFALALPVLSLMLVGMVDLSRYALQRSALLEGARQGAQYAAVAYSGATASSSTQSAYINTTAQNATGLSNVTASNSFFCECVSGTSASCTSTCGTGTLKRYVKVSVSEPFSSVVAGGGVDFGAFGRWTAPTSLSASVTMIVP